MTSIPKFRAYSRADMPACLAIFDANCPENFAPNERNDYTKFLEDSPEGYEVCEVSHSVAAAFGLVAASDVAARLVWIMIDPRVQGHGLGRIIMQRIMARSAAIGADRIHIAASHKSESFFARFGAVVIDRTEDGWGPGMHRVDMTLELASLPAG